MNEYVLHEQLLALEDIASQYADGAQCGERIRETVERIKTRLYRVAVIGEFKRGKSSLINAIIGAEVLPTDILPMTAAVTRVTYGEKRRILIRYKSGESEERTVEELIDFATKYDAQKEKIAAGIREIEVTYPSVFCKNHIDILDTPGLNDNESMTEVTLSVLGEVDAAIMVISAKAPLSLTEQNLILNMISQPQIRHIIFVVTHIDAISNRRSQQDKLIGFIRDRLSGELLEKAREMFAEKPRFLEKAGEILESPDIFGVSSVLAMDGFIHDDEELLEESRFPYFKKELLALLTAAQSSDVAERTVEAAQEVSDNLENWYDSAKNVLVAESMLWQEKRDYCNSYYAFSRDKLMALLKSMDEALAEKGIYSNELKIPELESKLFAPFIDQLSQLRTDTYTDDNIRKAIVQGGAEAQDIMQEQEEQLEGWIRDAIMDMLDGFMELREPCGFPRDRLAYALQEWSEQPFPKLRWTGSLVPAVATLRGFNIMPHVRQVIGNSLRVYAMEIGRYIASWRVTLIRQNGKDNEDKAPLVEAEMEISHMKMREGLLIQRYEQQQEKLLKIRQALEIKENDCGN